MKWYETPIEDLYDSARLALARNDKDLNYRRQLIGSYKQAIKKDSV